MQISSIPYKFQHVWAVDATSGFVTNPIPDSTTSPAASQQLGFPPATATPTAAGGTPPNINDFNGVLQYATSWLQWIQAGAPVNYDPTFQTNIGGYPAGATIKAASGYGYWLSLVDNNTTDPDTGGAGWTSAAPAGQPESSGLLAQNNVSNPTTCLDISANFVTFSVPPTGAALNVSAVTTVTNNILTAGPATNGRDQASAFSGASWVHFYLIYNPISGSVASISSVVAPPTGPTLPTGYIGWAYVGAIFLDGSSHLANIHIRGSWVDYDSLQPVLSGSATSATSVSVSGVVPPNALEYKICVNNIALTSNGIGAYALTASLGISASVIAYQVGLNGAGVANAITGISGGTAIFPNVNQTFYYANSVASGSGPLLQVGVNGYSVPNGGE